MHSFISHKSFLCYSEHSGESFILYVAYEHITHFVVKSIKKMKMAFYQFNDKPFQCLVYKILSQKTNDKSRYSFKMKYDKKY